jgi:C4-dicarboxylate-specific signal transduction histidine kinase
MQVLGQSRLTTRILFWVICASALMFSLVTTFTVWQQRERLYRAAQEDAERNVSRNIAAISIALWNFDKATLDALLLALTHSGPIIRAEVWDAEKQIAKIERVDESTKPDSVWEIPIIGPDNSRPIGILKISESYADVRDFFVKSLAVELISELIKIGGLAALLFIIIYRVVARHLQTLARDVSGAEPANVLTPIRLQRKAVRTDELDTLVDSINRFRAERANAEEALHRDIAERRRVEAALIKTESDLHEALRIAQLAYWQYDKITKEFIFNDQYYSLHRTSAEQVGGYRLKTDDFFEKLVHPEDGPALATYIQQVLQAQSRDHLGQIEVRILCADSATRWARVRCKTERTDGGASVRLIGTIEDITLRKLTEDALRAARAELAHSTQMMTMSGMAASIAHEIKQPLAAIVASGNAGLRWLARATPDVDEAQAALKRIVDDGHRAGEVIDGIRSMLKKDRQTEAPEDVNELVREVLVLLHDEIQSRQVSTRIELADSLPKVSANRVQLQQVLVNLIMNAVDAMSTIVNRARILRVQSDVDEFNQLMITVEDSGMGIDPKNIDRIFNPFFTTKSQGMGMGLSICQSIIERHGGRMSVSHGQPHGSIFHVLLPATGSVADR